MSATAEAVTATSKPSNVETVTMQDGRKVDFVGKRQMQKDSIIEGDSVSVRLDYRNGETRLFKVPSNLLLQFAGHGAEQKLGDEIAGLKDDKGNEADLDDKILAIDDLIDRLNKGEWSVKRESNGMAGTSVLLKALVEATGKTVEQVKEFLKAKTQQEKLALRASSRIKPIVDRMEAEKANKGAKIDTDALLGQLA